MATFAEHLRARRDDELVALLRLRPDLATPSPSTLGSLAARATARTSLERALGSVDAAVLQVVEAVVALEPGGPVDVARLAAAIGADDDGASARRALDGAVAAALVWRDGAELRAAPGLAEVLGPFPAGLGPRTGEHPAVDDVTEPQRAVLDALVWGPPVGVVSARGTPAAEVVADLVGRGLLLRDGPDRVVLPAEVGLALRGGRTHRGVALPPEPEGTAVPSAIVVAESARAAERLVRMTAALIRTWGETPAPVLRSGGVAVRDLRRLTGVLEADDVQVATVLELSRAAGLVADDGEERPSFVPTDAADDWLALPLPAAWAALVGPWLGAARAPWLTGTRDTHDAPRAALSPGLTRRWVPRLRAAVLAQLAAAPEGLAPSRASVLAGLRWRTPRAVPPGDAVTALLDEAALLGLTGAGALAPAGRAFVVDRAGTTTGGADDAELARGPGAESEVPRGSWADLRGQPQTRRSAARETSGSAAATGGTTTGRAATGGTTTGRATTGGTADPTTTGRATTVVDEAARQLAEALPAPVDRLVLQGDLTGIVPGRPSPELDALLTAAARAESRGGALTVRFTAESVRDALDAGWETEALLAALARFGGSVPQGLEYLVRDAGRRHGLLRAGLASSYVRSDDPTLLAGLPDDPRLAGLGLRLLAPTVLAASVAPAELVAALRSRGLSPVLEGPDGGVLRVAAAARRAPARATARATRLAAAQGAGYAASGLAAGVGPAEGAHDDAHRLAVLVTRLRAAEAADQRPSAPPPGPLTPYTSSLPSAPSSPSPLPRTRRFDSNSSVRTDEFVTNRRVRDGEDGVGGDGRGGREETVRGGGTADPGEALLVLREAAAARREVWVEIVGPRGEVSRRLLRPVRVDAGRLRAVDAARESELTVAVHRIASVSDQALS